MKKLFSLALISIASLCLTAAVAADTTKGQGIYMNFCASCHASGVAGAPAVGNRPVWQDRLSKGTPALVENAVKGFQGKTGFMPAKGGNSALTDEEVADAVMYMLEHSK